MFCFIIKVFSKKYWFGLDTLAGWSVFVSTLCLQISSLLTVASRRTWLRVLWKDGIYPSTAWVSWGDSGQEKVKACQTTHGLSLDGGPWGQTTHGLSLDRGLGGQTTHSLSRTGVHEVTPPMASAWTGVQEVRSHMALAWTGVHDVRPPTASAWTGVQEVRPPTVSAWKGVREAVISLPGLLPLKSAPSSALVKMQATRIQRSTRQTRTNPAERAEAWDPSLSQGGLPWRQPINEDVSTEPGHPQCLYLRW